MIIISNKNINLQILSKYFLVLSCHSVFMIFFSVVQFLFSCLQLFFWCFFWCLFFWVSWVYQAKELTAHNTGLTMPDHISRKVVNQLLSQGVKLSFSYAHVYVVGFRFNQSRVRWVASFWKSLALLIITTNLFVNICDISFQEWHCWLQTFCQEAKLSKVTINIQLS